MNLLEYMKDKIASSLIYISNLILCTYILLIFNCKKEIIIIIISLNLFVGIIVFLINYYKKNNFYNNLKNNINMLDKKYLVLETLPKPKNNEEKIIYENLYEINKSMIENIKNYENNTIEFKEFVEMWIHEVKLPISSLTLKCHNNKEKLNAEFLEQIRKLDNYIDQILYYVRSEDTEKDFAIKEINLVDLIRNVSLRNKDDLLENKIDLNVKDLDNTVHTDAKWLEFIISQIINNSIKYKKSNNSIIKINSKKDGDMIILSIWDNGIGIPDRDIARVFEKSFTGENGRKRSKSTGMGLYIAKKLCKKLGHKIEIESVVNEFTCVKIIFEDNRIYKF